MLWARRRPSPPLVPMAGSYGWFLWLVPMAGSFGLLAMLVPMAGSYGWFLWLACI